MAETKRFAVILSGCGVYDGSEIHEATMALWAITKHGCDYEIFAPDKEQHHVVNHLNGEEMNERRNVLVESARIARGKVTALDRFSAGDFDALLLPGGFGAAKNLSTFAFEGADCSVDAEVERAIREMVAREKPIGCLCISPVIIARILGDVELTIGQDPETAEAIGLMGGRHVRTGHGEVVIDKRYRIVTSPCYMLDANIVQIADGAENTVKAMLELI